MCSAISFLVTHTPPAGILDTDTHGEKGYGITALTSALCYTEHNITHHFFGHAHGSGGKTQELFGVQFINGAQSFRLHEVA